MKQHHIPLPVKSDIKRFEDSLPVHERALDVALIVTVRASLQIRVFGGEQWQQRLTGVACLSQCYYLVK